MNKKFSTLVASLLFASAFSAYAGTAASLITAPTSVVTKAIGADGSITFTPANAANLPAALAEQLNGFTDNSRLAVWKLDTSTPPEGVDPATGFIKSDGTLASYADPYGAFYFKYAAGQLIGQDGIILSIKATGTNGAVTAQKFDVVKVRDGKDVAATKPLTSFFLLREKTTGEYLTLGANGTDWTLVSEADAEAGKASLFASVSAVATETLSGTDLNAQLNEGFNLSIAFPGVKDATIKGAELFAGKLTAIDPTNLANPATGSSYYLKNKDDKFIVFDETIKNGVIEGGFKLQTATDVSTGTAAATFAIKVADNDPNVVEVSVDGNKKLYINRTVGATTAYSLTAVATVPAGQPTYWAVTSLGSSNTLDFNTLLTGKFVKVNYVKNGEESPANVYKINGILGLRDNAGTVEPDFVKTADVVADDPSTMWAPSINTNGQLVLTNRENTNKTLSLSTLREAKAGVYEATVATATGIANDDLITISFVDNTTKTDGYAVYANNVLINSTFYLGQSRRNADGDVPAYWAENHGTHQIGATVNKEEEATKWNVQLVKKGSSTLIDSVLVVSDLVAYNATTGVTTTTKDTLAVLPYVFQNRDNREFVKLNTEAKLNYYICDKDNNDAKDNGDAQVFALKKKPGNTYNYVTLTRPSTAADANVTPVPAVNGANKVYLKNSANKGTWENVATYSDDANSLMVVEPIDAPEYRKVVAAWGDTVRIYREEYPTEELFEKRDAKSVVDGETLSFLNVDNSITGANPALFVDTAYVNRVDANGVANTCYQYLLAVNVDKENSIYCPYNPEHNTDAWREAHGGPCADAKENPAVVKGRFLINLIDTANVYGATHLHSNPYVNGVEAGEKLAKLSFVEGIHSQDTLYITRKGGEVVKLAMDSPEFNVAKFAFRYVDNEAGTFKIQTRYKDYDPSATQKDIEDEATNEGYLKWINGTVVVVEGFVNGETFNMEENYAGNPTANENAPEVAGISVVATNGAVIVKGAEGKNVVITNVLGQTIANTTISSSEATIAAPAGVVVVAVEGEAAVKAIVK